MGYQPGLDGLRAVSVVAVILYHAGFSWMPGGFFGVEVFFVVSGFLITSLLLDERESAGRVSLVGFWIRRARRLLPALFAMLAAVALWTAVLGSAEQTSQLRRDLPWSLLYAANWGQIVGGVPYFEPADPPLLRHLWSLAVEEQWYLVWPFVFVALARSGRRPVEIARGLLGAAAVAAVVVWWIQRGAPAPMGGFLGLFEGADPVNVNYLSTVTRSGGLLLGAAAAFVWRPWRSPAARRVPSLPLDLTAGAALGLLVCCFATARLTAGYVYPWLLFAVSVLSLVLVLLVVHPASVGSRWVFARPALLAVGVRSYGLYLWHWPVFVVLGATDGSVVRFAVATAITIVLSELCYRHVETPIRRGAIGHWARSREPLDPRRSAFVLGGAITMLALIAFYVSVEPYDAAAGGEAVTFELTVAPPAEVAQGAATAVAPPPSAGQPAQAVPAVPRSLAIVGDSQAHSLAINLPDGIDSTFAIDDGSLDGCSVHDSGRVRSVLEGFRNDFGICAGWTERWATAAGGKDLALVVLGAWDVFDLEIDGALIPFASDGFDTIFRTNLLTGVDAMGAVGAHVALLEVACMRPQDVDGAGVPALPERADDTRVAHLNDLLRQVAASRPGAVTFVEGPDAWCGDEAVSADLGYRWDGVHVYRPGAKLIYETIAPALLAIPL